jgi:hypothetical protein
LIEKKDLTTLSGLVTEVGEMLDRMHMGEPVRPEDAFILGKLMGIATKVEDQSRAILEEHEQRDAVDEHSIVTKARKKG